MVQALRRLAPLLLVCGAVHADNGTIIFTRFGSVYERPADGGDAAEIAHLPDDASEVRFAEANRDGRLIVLDMGSYSVWLSAVGPDKPFHLQGGPCTGRARPSPTAEGVVCVGADGPLLVAAANQDRTALPDGIDEPQFRGQSGFDIAGLTDSGVIGFDKRKPDLKQTLSKSGARSHLFIAPNGEIAVAVFGEGAEGRVRSFLLDGDGIPRQLGGPGVPTLWSWDSTWVMFQEGDIKNAPAPGGGEDGMNEGAADPFLVGMAEQKGGKKPAPKRSSGRRPPPAPPPLPTRVCVARATGGEVKCWDNYTGMAFSPDSTLVLLKKEKSLYVGKIAGVRPEPPVKILDDVDGAATWVPNLNAAPLPKEKPKLDFEL